jgi:hypothetical protein
MDRVSMPTVIIRLSKRKVGLLLLGAVAFVAGSIWIWYIADSQSRYDPLYMKGVAVAGASFFGLCGVYGCYKLFDTRPGLIIDDGGIVDNSSAVAAGRIPWNEVSGLKISEIAGQRFLVIEVINPQKYVEQGGFLMRMLNSANTKLTGSPINISSNSLSMDFDELVRILTRAFQKSKQPAEQAAAPRRCRRTRRFT